MNLPLIVFLIVLVAVIFFKWQPKIFKKQEKSEENDKQNCKDNEKSEEKKMKSADIVKISAAGVIFLFLLWVLAPEFIVRHHKEIAVMVIAMIVGASLLSLSQKWEENSTRKILRFHYIALTIFLVLTVIYNDPETGKWFRDSQPQTTQTDYPLCAGPTQYDELKKGAKQIRVPLNPRCWSGWIVMPNYKFKLRFSSPGELEFKFLEGERILLKATDPPTPMGDIGKSYFQLRGDGDEVIFTVEKI